MGMKGDLMKKTKLAMIVGVAAQLALPVAAEAAGWTAQSVKIYAADPQDTARVNNGRLRKTRNEETQEQAEAILLDGTNGVYLMMQAGRDSAGNQPINRTQLSCTPFKLVQAADGSVAAEVTGKNVFVTDNKGQNHRDANLPHAYAFNGGKNVLITYNYRPNNNTERYAKVLDAQCNLVPVQNAKGQSQKQVLIMAKNNDDCDMSQSGEGAGILQDGPDGAHLTYWAGCNGNGRDDGWVNDVQITPVNNGAAFKIAKNFDVDVEPQEERSRGRCTIAASDPNTAICTWTAGNSQPQRDGTWIGAIDISPNGAKGENAKGRLLWKKKIDDQKKIAGVRTYSVRANSSRVLDASGQPSDLLFVQTSDLRGNNTNNRKGGRYLRMNLGVAQATRSGLKWAVPMTDVTDMMLGIDATHLTEAATLVDDNGKLVPAMTFLAGDQNGGSHGADFKVLGFDATAAKFVDYGTHPLAAAYDRHLYSNYLGQNPGNQGRNYAGSYMIKSPFATGAKYLMLSALTGKAAEDVAKPEIKTSAFLSVIAMENPAATPPPPAGMPNTTNVGQTGTGGGQNSAPQPGDPTPANELPAPASNGPAPATPGTFTSGCSMATAGGPVDGVFLLLGGLALIGLVRRRQA